MESNGKYITVSEAAKLAGVSRVCVYKHLQRGNLTFTNVNKQGREVKQIKKSDIIDFFSKDSKPFTNVNNEVNNVFTNVSKGLQTDNKPVNNPKLTLEDINEQVKKAVMETIEEQKGQLMKPLQEQALFIAGELKNEVKHLRAEKEILQQENEVLQSQLKALPGPPGEIIKKLEKIELEKTDLQSRLQSEERQKEELKLQQDKKNQEKELLLQQRQKDIEKLQTEKEHLLTAAEQELNKIKRKAEELQTQKEKATQKLHKKIEEKELEEKNLLATIEALKERVEAEEKKSWWQKLFGN